MSLFCTRNLPGIGADSGLSRYLPPPPQACPVDGRFRPRRSYGRGFTLIEILIVVVILGILAAIVMPQFSSASAQGRRNTLLAVVQTLRTQIAFYKIQHGDVLPDLTANGGNNWTLLTQPSTFAGQTVGPYMQTVPTSPVNSLNRVVNGDGTVSAGTPCGYIYDYNSGNGSGAIWGTDIDGVTVIPQ